MDGYAVLKGASYTLAATPNMVIHNGTIQATETITNPESEYLKGLPSRLRSFRDAANYMPNRVYIGNEKPQKMAETGFPWYDELMDGVNKDGKYGEVTPEDEFYSLIQIYDVFGPVKLERGFVADTKTKLDAYHIFTDEHVVILDKSSETTREKTTTLMNNEYTEPLYFNNALVGTIERVHDADVNLSARVMLENPTTKASNALSLLNLIKKAGVNPIDIDYVADCCEEACGDMNQRDGGNFAKAAAEATGFVNATGPDVRGFCTGPAHTILHAAALVKAEVFKNVVVTADGRIAKLGMSDRDHVKKGLSILEDTIAGFSVLMSADDGANPQIGINIVGHHTVRTGSAPQNVTSSLVTNPLDEVGLEIVDIDKYSPEMQNPGIARPVDAGDVPEVNCKMIAALGVRRGGLRCNEITSFVRGHGMVGWAPTQGHIPSDVPHLGPLRDEVLIGETRHVMTIGKGSLSLGRMTNLFDGVFSVVQANDGSASKKNGDVDESKVRATIGQAMRAFAQGPMGEEE